LELFCGFPCPSQIVQTTGKGGGDFDLTEPARGYLGNLGKQFGTRLARHVKEGHERHTGGCGEVDFRVSYALDGRNARR